MELQAIAEKTQLPLRKLRYVLDHRMLPGLAKIDETAVGRPRYFTDFESFVLACTATLLVGGLKREAAIQCMDGLAELTWEGEPYTKRPAATQADRAKRFRSLSLYSCFYEAGPAVVMLGDGANVRVQSEKRDTGWRQPGTLARLDGYQPLVLLQMDLAQLRARLK